MLFCFKLIAFLALNFHLNGLVRATANSVCGDAGYALLRPCAQGCIGCDPRPDQVAYKIGCGPVPPNECWCRTDLISLASSAISNCVSRSCSVGGWEGDYSSAIHFYTSYCQQAGFTATADGPADAVATLTIDSNAPTITIVTVVTPSSGSSASISLPAGVDLTSFRTATTRSQVIVEITSTLRNLANDEAKGGSGGGSGMSSSDKIALGVGIGFGLPATIAALVTCCFLVGRRRG